VGVLAGVAVDSDAEVADTAQEFEGVDVRAYLVGSRSGLEQLCAHGHEAVEEVGVQGKWR